jgi:hypothetical protein
MSQSSGPGRRIAQLGRPRALSLGLALAVGAPALTGLALAVQAPAHHPEPVVAGAPQTAPLTSAALACPRPLDDAGSVSVLSATEPEASGEVSVVSTARGARAVPLPIGAGEVERSDTAAATPVVVRGSEGLAPGLVAARFGPDSDPAAAECVTPLGERWFVGVGAGGFHRSRVELVNPGTGPAVADISLWSTDGPMEEVQSRGLTIPGGRGARLNLSRIAPHRNDLAVRVSVTRGQVMATFLDAFSPGTGRPARDWVSTTAAPTDADQIIPALARQADERTLVLVNPGDDEGRVTLQVVGRRSTFQPSALEEIRVPAGRVVVTDLTRGLARAVADDDASLVVSSTVPIGVGLREVVAGDLVHHPGMTGAAGAAAALVAPTGQSVVVVAPTEVTGNFTLEFVGRTGTTRAVVQARTAGSFRVPPGSSAVIVRAEVPYVAAVRTIAPGGAALLPLRPLVLEQLLPAVAPAWP